MSRPAGAPLGARFQVLGAALLFSTGGAAIKATAFTSWQVAGLRSGIAAVTVLLLLREARRRMTWRAAAVGVAYAGALLTYAVANKLTTAANTIFLQSTAPLYILVLAPLLLGERLRRRDLLFMVAVAAGLALFFVEREAAQATAPQPLAGNLLAAAGGVCWAVAVVGLRWLGRGGADRGESAAAVVAGNVLALAFTLPLVLPTAGSLAEAAATDWLLIVYLGAVQIGLAYVLLTDGLRSVEALEASLLLLIEPVLNPIWAWWLHGETASRWAVVGGGLILGATVVRVVAEALRSRRLRR